MTLKLFLGLTLMLICFVALSCSNSTEKGKISKEQEKTNVVKESKAESADLIIENNSFMGISPNEIIENQAGKLKYGKIRDGEAIKEGFVIEVYGQELGYALPNKEDK